MIDAAHLLIVDDHPLFRDGFARMAEGARPGWTVHFASGSAEALLAIGAAPPDCVVVDVGLPDGDGFALLKAIAQARPAVRPMLISGRDDAAVRVRARASGAHGFIAKTMAPAAIVAAIEAVLAGGTAFAEPGGDGTLPTLTTRQAEVLALLGEGHGNKEIRHRLGIAERTVRAHLTELFQLLGVHSRMQAVLRARELGLIG